MSFKLWTNAEFRLAETCVMQGMAPGNCIHLFPGRSYDSLLARFKGIRRKHGLGPPKPAKPGPKIAPRQSVDDPLLRRQLQTGQHFIRDRAQFDRLCAAVGLAA